MDVAERELGRMIERRSDGSPDPEELEPSYAESVRVYNARRRDEMRAAWASYHRGHAARLRRNLEALISHHEAQASKLCENEPKGAV